MRSKILSGRVAPRWLGALALLGGAAVIGCSTTDTQGFIGTPAVIRAVGGTDINSKVGDTLGPYSVKVTDTAGNGVAGVTVTFSIVGNATLVNTTATTDQDGGAFTSIVLGHTVGNMTITATANGIATPALFQTHSYAGPATTFALAGGGGQNAPRGTAVTEALTVSVTDQYGNGVGSVLVTWQATAGTLGTPSGRTGANGVVSTTYTLPATPGAQTITASALINGTAPSVITLTATGT